MLADDAGGARHGDGVGRGALGAGPCHLAGRGKAPAAVHEGADAEAVRLAVADVSDLAFARADRLTPVAADARVGVGRATLAGRVERFVGDVDRGGIGAGRGERLRARLARQGSAGSNACGGDDELAACRTHASRFLSGGDVIEPGGGVSTILGQRSSRAGLIRTIIPNMPVRVSILALLLSTATFAQTRVPAGP